MLYRLVFWLREWQHWVAGLSQSPAFTESDPAGHRPLMTHTPPSARQLSEVPIVNNSTGDCLTDTFSPVHTIELCAQFQISSVQPFRLKMMKI